MSIQDIVQSGIVYLTQEQSGVLAPIIICSVCRQRIKNSDAGNAIWNPTLDKTCKPDFVHKRCYAKFIEENDATYCINISEFLLTLACNCSPADSGFLGLLCHIWDSPPPTFYESPYEIPGGISGIYILWFGGYVGYVGQSVHIAKRIRQHKYQRHISVNDVTRAATIKVRNKTKRDAMELALIWHLGARYNQKGHRYPDYPDHHWGFHQSLF